MIMGRNPRTPVIGDTVLSSVDRCLGTGIIVDIDAIRYKVYWRDGIETLRWHARRELTIPRLDYDGNGRDAPHEICTQPRHIARPGGQTWRFR